MNATRLDIPATWPTAWAEFWQERAGIRQFDGNLSRDVAESGALQDLLAELLSAQGIAYTPGSIPTPKLLDVGGM